ncbi:DUF2087 domain-containing protein [Evansella tamaricis]|uniref:DUF2087 domain-containing protein n=1 Tax=Evansella tamaricis TaxID=2069301 RepID=A0ABS6JD76_9BACI|nr:DUF2087 domain-containing protein [Evansella tamaricis]MBU9711438.1 DUF2087 domain-containing protein [Evansella tamaricis]
MQFSIKDLKQGFHFDEQFQLYHCIFCEEKTREGYIYPDGNLLVDARMKMIQHVKEQHDSPFQGLLSLDKRHNGLTDSQKQIIKLFYEGKKDDEIAEKQGLGSSSTVRQHRFKFREKLRQAKVFQALMEIVEESNKNDQLVAEHKGAKMVDERWLITKEEQDKILNTYLTEEGIVKQFPSKEKRKIVILKYILSAFKQEINYSEREVNETIKKYYDDFVTIRRYFIEYGFMKRNRDGSAYWLN